ncbi:Leucine-rich repeat-containing protein 43 [Phlyctochytrium bullatum]|nr:Leucine-rich repeat-containing protein 43 [Phlyctochytrium bullatum]
MVTLSQVFVDLINEQLGIIPENLEKKQLRREAPGKKVDLHCQTSNCEKTKLGESSPKRKPIAHSRVENARQITEGTRGLIQRKHADSTVDKKDLHSKVQAHSEELSSKNLPKKRTDSAFNTVALHIPKAPLTLSDLRDEDAEGVFEDCQHDNASQIFDWSDEAILLKQIKYERDRKAKQEIRQHLAEVNKQLQELELRSAGGDSSNLASPVALNAEKQKLERLLDSAHGSFTEEYLFEFFNTLKLLNAGIRELDTGVLRFKNMKELSLTGNLIEKLSNLPPELTILHVNANNLSECPDISQVCAGNPASTVWFPMNIVSIDLSGNDLEDLEETIAMLENARNLKILSLLERYTYVAKDQGDETGENPLEAGEQHSSRPNSSLGAKKAVKEKPPAPQKKPDKKKPAANAKGKKPVEDEAYEKVIGKARMPLEAIFDGQTEVSTDLELESLSPESAKGAVAILRCSVVLNPDAMDEIRVLKFEVI